MAGVPPPHPPESIERFSSLLGLALWGGRTLASYLLGHYSAIALSSAVFPHPTPPPSRFREQPLRRLPGGLSLSLFFHGSCAFFEAPAFLLQAASDFLCVFLSPGFRELVPFFTFLRLPG